MDLQAAAQQMVQLVSSVENELFSGSFTESSVKSDFSYRPEKRSFYIESFSDLVKSMDMVINAVEGNPTAEDLVSRAKKNKNQAQKMLDYVRSN